MCCYDGISLVWFCLQFFCSCGKYVFQSEDGIIFTKEPSNISYMMFLVDYKLSGHCLAQLWIFVCHSFTQSDFSTNFWAGKNQQSNQGEAFSKFDSETPPINKALLDSKYIVNVISPSENVKFHPTSVASISNLPYSGANFVIMPSFFFFFCWPCLSFFRTGAVVLFPQALLSEHIRTSCQEANHSVGESYFIRPSSVFKQLSFFFYSSRQS